MSEAHTTAPNGLKYDAGKPPMTLLDRFVLEEVAKVLAYGEAKYARHNWRKGIAVSRNLDAAIRHILASNEEDIDPESGLPHMAHAICCLMFALWTSHFKPELDDRLLKVEFAPSSEPTTFSMPLPTR